MIAARLKNLVRSLPDRLLAFVAAPRFEALAPFRSRPAPAAHFTRKSLFFSFCLFLGVFYGFWGTVLPSAFIIFLIVPFLVMALLILWILPDSEAVPDAFLDKLLFAFTAVTFLWPNYLAIAIPGLPWMSMRRIVGLFLVAVFLYALAGSSRMRVSIIEALKSAPLLSKFVIAFFVCQTISIAFSPYPVLAYKHWFNSQFSWTAVFFLSAYVFSRPGRVERWARLICTAAIIVSLIAIVEQRYQMVLWANHIPSIFKMENDDVERILSPTFRNGQYRSQAIFGVSLALAEFLALAFTLFMHRFFLEKDMIKKSWFAVCIVAVLAAIVFSRARLGLVGVVVGIGLYSFVWGYRRFRENKTDLTGAALTFGYPALAATAMTLILSVDALRFRILGSGTQQSSNDGRQAQYDMAPPVIAHSPLFGYGGGRGADALGYTTPGGFVTIDTYILSIVLDYGIIGFIFYYGFIFLGAGKAAKLSINMRNAPDDPEQREIGYLLPFGVILLQFFWIKTVLSQEENHSMIFIILGAILALVLRANHAKAKSGHSA